jgi:hypothetical protein
MARRAAAERLDVPVDIHSRARLAACSFPKRDRAAFFQLRFYPCWQLDGTLKLRHQLEHPARLHFMNRLHSGIARLRKELGYRTR